MTSIITSSIFILTIVLIFLSVKTVPQNTVFVIERLSKYSKTLTAGLNFIVPFIDRVAYKRSYKETAIDIPQQSAITQDNIGIELDGIVYIKVLDGQKSCYGVENYENAILQLAQTTMRSEIGKLSLEKTFNERSTLNSSIVETINKASEEWGCMVLRYEIKDIKPPRSILDAMEQQLKADRLKRAAILESEGQKESAINIAEGNKQTQVLTAEGEAEAMLAVATAQAEALKIIGEQAETQAGQAAINLSLAEKAIDAKKAMAKESTLIVVPESSSDIASMIAQVTAIIPKGGK